MKSLFAIAAILFATSAQAHIEKGVWIGKAADGSACQMTVGDQYFEQGMHHPLNERIPLEINGVSFVVGHPAVIDSSTSTAGFNHDLFQGINATATGAVAVEIAMSHTEEFEGPTQFTLINHDYKSGVRSSLVCKEIALQ